MKITCPKCAFIIDAGNVPDTLLPLMGDATLSVRCPNCASEIELAVVAATLSYAGDSSSTWRGAVASIAPDPASA